jgi:hypothetical protein
MAERHTVDFVRDSFNLVSDAERRTITLQFESYLDRRKPIPQPIGRILKAIESRYGGGLMSRLTRWRRGESNPLVLPSRSQPHPDNPEVLCFEIGVRPGATMESALASLCEYLRQQPGYERMFGAPLDRDQPTSRVRKAQPGDASKSAHDIIHSMITIRRSL